MNKLLATLAIPTLLASCGTSNDYSVRCALPDLDGDSVYIDHLSFTDDDLPRLSAKVEHGEALFQGTVDDSELMCFTHGDNLITFILEPGDIVLDLQSGTASGTPLNDALQLYVAQSDSLQNSFALRYDSISHSPQLSPDDRFEQLEELMMQYNQTSLSRAHRIIDHNPDNVLGRLVFLADIARNECMTPQLYESEIAAASAYIASFEPVEKATRYYHALSRTAVGEPYTDLEFVPSEGPSVRLSDYIEPGKLTLLHFWASWSAPSRTTMQAVSSIYDEFPKDKITVVNINTWDSEHDARNVVNQLQIKWPQIYGADTEHAETYAITDLPFVMLIDSEGRILARNLRPNAIRHWVATELKD